MLRFRSLGPNDFSTLLDWLQRPHVKEWWDDGDDTIEKVVAHYTSDLENTRRYIVVYDGEDAGFFQYHRFDSSHIGVDQFLAKEDQLSRGLGTLCLKAFIDMIVAREAPKFLSVDPEPANKRAIRCYEKCGFQHDPNRSTASVYFMVWNC